ncbi:MAG: methyltransferase, TIGR04325 family [Patescibacteria group bacterium]
MRNKIKKIFLAITPPAAVLLAKKIFARSQYEYTGDFANWETAYKQSSGYDDGAVFEKVKKARLRVLSGEKKYERDSVVFDSVQYFWPLLSALLFAAAEEKGRLSVLDFGGSLGSTYFQNLSFLKNLPSLSWGVVEQKHFVEFGKKSVANPSLSFFETIEECATQLKPNVALFSSSIQYLERPYEILEKIKKLGLPYLIFDRTTILDFEPDRITLQTISKRIYDACFPTWFLSREKLISFLNDSYEHIEEWPSLGDPLALSRATGRYKGFLFKLKNKPNL